MTDIPQHPPDRQASGRTLASGIAYLTLAGLAMNVCLFLVNLALIHVYGKAVHGGVAWLVSVAGIAVGLSDLGIASAAAARSIARRRAEDASDLGRTVATWMTLQMLLGIVAAAGAAVLAEPLAGLCKGVSAADLRIGALWILGLTGIRACAMVAVGFEAMRESLLMSPVAELARLLAVLAAWAAGAPIRWLLIAWAGCYALSIAVSAWRVRALTRRAGVKVRFSAVRPVGLAAAAAEALPYYVPFLGLFCLPFAAQVMVGISWPREQISIFQVCFSLAMTVRLVSAPIAGAILPRVAHIDASHADHSQTGDVLRQSARLLGSVSTLLFAGAVALAGPVMRILYGPAYADNVDTLLVLLAFGAVDSYAMPLDQVLKATRHVGLVAALEAARYAIMLAIAWWSVPAYGPIGAAWAILAGLLAATLVKMLVARRLVGSLGAAALAAAGAVLLILAAISRIEIGAYLAIPAWLAAALALRLLRPADLAQWARIIRDAMRKRASR